MEKKNYNIFSKNCLLFLIIYKQNDQIILEKPYKFNGNEKRMQSRKTIGF